MRRAALALALAVAAAVLPTAAHAESPDGGRSVERWDATYDLQPDGSARVAVEIDLDFGDDPGHGPFWTLVTRQGYDETFDRVYAVTDIAASSPTGAPAAVHLEEGEGYTAVRVGDEAIDDVSGVQTYVLTYTIHDVMNATSADETETGIAGDELYWNAIGDGWSLPIRDVTVRVNGAADVQDARCFAGTVGVVDGCDAAETAGGRATFTQSALEPGEPLTVAVLYPAGTFATEPVLVERDDLSRAFSLTPWTVGGALLILLGGGYALVRLLLHTGTDRQYAGIIPGTSPALGSEAPTEPRDKRAPVAVAFQPPLGLRPGQLGTLIDETADPRDVTATVVDLAVRDYLLIEEVAPQEGGRSDYALVRRRAADDGLVPYERMLFDALFEGRDRVTLTELTTTFHADMAAVQAQLYRNVTDRGWFKRNPSHARTQWGVIGGVVLVLGAVVTVLLAATTSVAVLGLPIPVLGIMMLATIPAVPARTAEGSRILAETRGFELYLRTAEADQLRFEEGHDVFGRYLPFAIAFGVAKEWSGKFEALARQGVRLAEPTWYRGAAYGLFWAHAAGFGDRMTEFAALTDAAMSAPTPGSSGGSGFSGGGFAGGGGGGGGGGAW